MQEVSGRIIVFTGVLNSAGMNEASIEESVSYWKMF